jgi:hypothetical protein
MKALDSSRCAMCDAPSVEAPRLLIEQDRHYDCPFRHQVGLCDPHGAELRAGVLAPQRVIYEWTQKHHDELYDGTRLILMPRLTCLACNGSLEETEDERVACPACGAINRIGSALGYPATVGLVPA